MAKPCFEPQTKEKLKVPVAVSKAFMNEMLETIKGGKSYTDALEEVAFKSGLQPGTINTLLRRDPKTFSLTKQAIAQAGKVRQIRDAAEGFAESLKNDGAVQAGPGNIAKAWDIQRRIALGGHSPVFPWTHMRNWAVQIPTEAGRARMNAFWRSAVDVWKYGGEKGRALYEMDMGLMQAGDRFDFWKSSGADIEPGKRTPGDMLLQSRKPSWQTRNFDALKTARYTALEDAWSRVDPALKEGKGGAALGAMIARDMNYATSSLTVPKGESANVLAKTASQLSQAAGHYNLLLSSKLFFAKHMEAWLNPLRYIAKAGRMSAEERAASNIALSRWANIVTTHLGILGVNYAFNKAVGWKPPNLTNPNSSDYLRLRLGNHIVPFSPMLEALRLPIVTTAAMVSSGSDEAGTRLWRAAWNAAHPSAHFVYEQASGKDFMGKPVPSIRNLISPVKSKKEPVTIGEYLGTRFTPIAISGGIHQYYQTLRDHGLDASQASAFIQSALASAGSVLTGMHEYEMEEKPPKKQSISIGRIKGVKSSP